MNSKRFFMLSMVIMTSLISLHLMSAQIPYIVLQPGQQHALDNVLIPLKKDSRETVDKPRIEPDYRKYATVSCGSEKKDAEGNHLACTVKISKKAPRSQFRITQKHTPMNTKQSSYVETVANIYVTGRMQANLGKRGTRKNMIPAPIESQSPAFWNIPSQKQITVKIF